MIVLRAGDVIPQVVSPAPHVAERTRPPAAPQPPARCPFCDTPTVKPTDGVFTKCPNRDCPAPAMAAAQALRLARRDGHRRTRREAGRRAAGARTRAHGRRLLRLTEEQLLELEGFGEISAKQAARGDRGLQGSGRSRASCSRSGSRRSARSPPATWPQRFATSTPAGRHAGGDRATPGIGAKMAVTIAEQLADAARARADPAPARRPVCASRRRARRRRGAAGRHDASCSPAPCRR